jgi:signal transduction histidine kinase
MFRKTLFKLTLQYSALLLIIFTLFSGGIYEYMDHTFGGDYRHQESSIISGSRAEGAAVAADAGLDRLKYALIFSYIILLLMLPAVSYILAKRALEPVEKSYDEQQRFVDDASHEMRTPLSVIQGELELALKKERTPDQYKASIKTSLEEVDSLNGLVNNLLLMARGSHTELTKAAAAIRLDEVTLECISKTNQAYLYKHLNFNTDITDVTINGIESLVSQSIYNLLDNAAKFSDDKATITVSLTTDEDYASITITDTGKGMTDEQIKYAFNRFWRADSARTVKGFGLGLPLVAQILKLHDGTVALRRNNTSGITAHLRFPL